MATKMKRLGFYLRTFLLLIWTAAHGGDGYSCPYGQTCGYEPAPPGRAPACAQPGLTYCVHTDPYPEEVIRKLISSGQYDVRTLLSDETREDFNSHKKTDYPYGYGPNSLPNVDQISLVNEVFPKSYSTKFHSRFNHDLFSQKTPLQPPSAVDPIPYNLNAFQGSNFTKFGYHGYHTSPSYWNTPSYDSFDKKIYRQNSLSPNGGYNQNYFDSSNLYPNYDTSDWFRQAASGVGVTQYNPNEWWKYINPSRSDTGVRAGQQTPSFPRAARRAGRKKRNAELVKAASKRTLTGAEALRIALGLANEDITGDRPRRQTGNVQELCRARTEYVTPRAALNNRGSWRYVVNMPDNMTQLVRAEICMSSECSGLCTVPRGYTSRCEQKYIQKRLVALRENGENLYTDLFWIPSCCQCTIVTN